MPVEHMSADKMPADKILVGQMLVEEMPVEGKSAEKRLLMKCLSPNKMLVDDIFLQTKCL